jgi:arginyl-tRNA synthetase
VLHRGIGEDRHRTAQVFAIAHDLVGLALNDALTGEVRAGEDTDPHETVADGGGGRHRAVAIVAQNIDPQRYTVAPLHLVAQRRQAGDRMRRHAAGVEGRRRRPVPRRRASLSGRCPEAPCDARVRPAGGRHGEHTDYPVAGFEEPHRGSVSHIVILVYPVFHSIEQQISSAFRAHIQARYGIDLPVAVEQPRQSGFGEMAVPAAFQLAKQLHQAPKKIAAELVDEIGAIAGVASLEVAGNGYLNVRLDRAAYGAALLRGETDDAAAAGEKIIVEHTNINPNKAAHIGHLRNAILGDTFVRMMRARGQQVEVQNYIDNTGVQVADVVVGFHYVEHKTAADVRTLIADPAVRFDYYCWDLYARTSASYDTQPETRAWRSETLHSIEAGEGEQAELAHIVADAIVEKHLATMLRLGIEYDVLPRESEILHLKFWAYAYELLKERKAIYLETEGKNAGCWVLPGLSDEGKVIVRSNGIVTYVGKDIAYQLWKFGLLGKDFFYREFQTYADGRRLWVTTDVPTTEEHHFGCGSRVFNVIDARQSYLQDVVVAGLRALGYEKEAAQSIHFSYEMVALSPRCCADLGIALSEEDRKRPYVEVSGRKGLGVKADDLMDALIAKALDEVASRHADETPERNRAVATQIAMGALRYFLLKFTRNSVIAFDFQEALSFEGETGPYVQYAAVRAQKILKELEVRGERLPDFATELTPAMMAHALETEDFWQVLLAASKADSAVDRALEAGEPAHVARYAFQLAQAFANFYQKHHILNEQDRARKVYLLWMTDFFRRQLERVAGILGISIPEYM